MQQFSRPLALAKPRLKHFISVVPLFACTFSVKILTTDLAMRNKYFSSHLRGQYGGIFDTIVLIYMYWETMLHSEKLLLFYIKASGKVP